MTTNSKWKRNFFTIAIGQTASLIGSSAVQFALIWWLASETSSPLIMAFAGFLAFLPQFLLGPFAGVWIDRLKRKTVVISADLFMGFAALLFAFCFLIGKPPFWAACVVLGVRAIGNVFHTPAIQAIIPMLVPKEELLKANGVNQFMQSGAFMLGPVLGAAMYAALPLPIILLTDFLGAIIACATVLIVKIPEPKHEKAQNPHFFNEMKEGVCVLIKDKKLFILILAATASMLFFLPLSSYYPLMTSSYFKATPWHASLVEILYAGGMMGSALIISAIGTIKHKFFLAQLGILGIGITSFLCGLLPPSMGGFWVFSVICMIMGGSGNFYSIPCMAYMQETIPPEALGRAFSLIGSLMSISMPVGLLISGPIAEKFGVSCWFLVSGIAIFIIVPISMICMKHFSFHSEENKQ